MNVIRWAGVALLILASPHLKAQTTVTQWGVTASTAYADCSLAFPCNLAALTLGLWLPSPHTQAGGLNQTSASQINVPQVHGTLLAGEINMGVTSAQVQLDNANLSVPVLKAKAASFDDNGWVSALAFGIQGYTYIGASPTTLTLDAALSGVIVNPPTPINGGAASDVTGFSVGVWLLAPDPDVAFPSTPAATLGQLVGSVLASTVVVDSWLPADVNAAGSVSSSKQLSIALDPSEEFYLLAGLVASATGPDHSADAFGTLTMDFSASAADVLTPASVAAIPEPKIYVTLLVGLSLIGTIAYARGKTARSLVRC